MKLWVIATALSIVAATAIVSRLRDRRSRRNTRIGSQPVSSEWLAKARAREEHQY